MPIAIGIAMAQKLRHHDTKWSGKRRRLEFNLHVLPSRVRPPCLLLLFDADSYRHGLKWLELNSILNLPTLKPPNFAPQ
jgi:hypothetical protein